MTSTPRETSKNSFDLQHESPVGDVSSCRVSETRDNERKENKSAAKSTSMAGTDDVVSLRGLMKRKNITSAWNHFKMDEQQSRIVNQDLLFCDGSPNRDSFGDIIFYESSRNDDTHPSSIDFLKG